MHTTTALQLDWLLLLKTSRRKIRVVELLEKNNLSADPDNPHYLVCACVCVYEVSSVLLWDSEQSDHSAQWLRVFIKLKRGKECVWSVHTFSSSMCGVPKNYYTSNHMIENVWHQK